MKVSLLLPGGVPKVDHVLLPRLWILELVREAVQRVRGLRVLGVSVEEKPLDELGLADSRIPEEDDLDVARLVVVVRVLRADAV